MTRLPECEERIMVVCWELHANDEKFDMQRITEYTNEKFGLSWATQTVSSFLARLRKRGYLSMKRSGRTFFYTPEVEKMEYFSKVKKELFDLFGVEE